MFISRLVAVLFVLAVGGFVTLATFTRDPADSATRLPADLDLTPISMDVERFDALASLFIGFESDSADLEAITSNLRSQMTTLVSEMVIAGWDGDLSLSNATNYFSSSFEEKITPEVVETLGKALSIQGDNEEADSPTTESVLVLSNEERRINDFGNELGSIAADIIGNSTIRETQDGPLIGGVNEVDVLGGLRAQFNRPQRVAFELIEPEMFTPEIEAPGATSVNRRTQIRARTSSPVEEIFADRGDFVESGQLIAQLAIDGREAQKTQAEANISQAQASIAQAEASLAQAQANLDSAKASIPQAESAVVQAYSNSESSIAQAEASLSQAEANLESAEASIPQAESALVQAFANADANIAQAEASLSQARANLGSVRASKAQAEANLSSVKASIGSTNAQVAQAETSLADANQALADITALGDFASEAQRRNANSNVSQATQSLNSALAASAQGSASIAQAEASLSQAQANLESAEASIPQAEASLAQARANATASITQAETGLLQARANLESSEASIPQAEAALAQARANAAASITQAETGLLQAQANLDSAEASIPQAEASLAQAYANLESAEASLDQIELDMDRLSIRAPYAGRIEQRTVEVGSLVNAGDNIFTITDLNPMVARAAVSDTVRQTLKLGDIVNVVIGDGATALEQAGPITLIDTTSIAATRTFEVEVELENSIENGQPTIVDNQFATLTFSSEPVSAYRIPQSALTSTSFGIDDEGTTGLLVVDDKSRVAFLEINFSDYNDGGELIIAADRIGNGPLRLIIGRGGFVKIGDLVDGRRQN